MLDDAAGHEQVRPLLPGTPGSLVLITSRRRLAALDDAAVVSLDTLTPGEAAGLLARLAGRAGVTAGDPAVGELAALCGYLPLAIGMAGRQLAHHPAWTAAGLAAELAAAEDRLELMAAENLSVAAAFGLSYDDLDDGQQRLFRRLGLHPGPDIDAYAAAALDGTSLAQARRGLEALYDQHLITQPASGRYRLHDLLREHARTLAAADDPAACDAAAGRLLDYYLHTAWAAGQHFPAWTIAEGPPPPGRPPASAPPVSTPRQAAALAGDRARQPARGRRLRRRQRDGPCTRCRSRPRWTASWTTRGYWDQGLVLHQAALAAARQAGDRAGQAQRSIAAEPHANHDRGHPRPPPPARPGPWSCTATSATGSGRQTALTDDRLPARDHRRLPGRRRRTAPGAGAVPRPRPPARARRCPPLPGRRAPAVPGTTRPPPPATGRR